MDIIEQIKNHGYVEVKLGIENELKKALSDYREFLNFNIDKRKNYTFPIERALNSEIGYVPREDYINKMTGYPYDYKDVFHFEPSLVDRVISNNLYTEFFENWFKILSVIYKKAENIADEVIKKLIIEYPQLNKLYKKQIGVLRLLHYHMKERSEGVIGLGHIDEWYLTINIFENIPGLKIKESELLERQSGVSIIYPGRKMENETNGDLKALYHEVVKVNENSTDRYSITFFFDL